MRSKTAFLHLVVEYVFAALPLFVLGLALSSRAEGGEENFWTGPEWSMTSCVLFGLSLARYLQGIPSIVESIRASPEAGTARLMVMALVPLLGVIVSVIFVCLTASPRSQPMIHVAQFGNLILATAVFFILGGWGLSRSELAKEK